jgi:hypothetical protein
MFQGRKHKDAAISKFCEIQQRKTHHAQSRVLAKQQMPTKARSINTKLTPVNKAARNKDNKHYQWTPNYLRKLGPV